MRSKIISVAAAVIFLVAAPAFASDDAGIIPDNVQETALQAFDAGSGDECGAVSDGARGDKDGDGAGEEESAGAAEKYSEGGIAVVISGSGRAKVNGSGHIEIVPGRNSEAVSITADKGAGGIKAGDQIPELEVEDIEFEDGTVITVIFGASECGDDPSGLPESAAAIF